MPESQRFQLPDLVGREAHLYPGQTAEVVRVKVEVTPGQYADVIIGKDLLIPMEPPLPEEPPVGSVVLVDGEPAQRLGDVHPHSWSGIGNESRYTWAQLCGIATPVQLIPDPAAAAELPWEHPVDGAVVRVGTDALCSGVDVGFLGHIGRCLPADAAHAMAAALLAAAATAQERAKEDHAFLTGPTIPHKALLSMRSAADA